MTLTKSALTWLLFYLIALGLGYAPLGRYDPARNPGTSDVATYRAMVLGVHPALPPRSSGPYERLAMSENYYRLLVPCVARPFCWLVQGRVRSWDPALFALLAANAIFTATTAYILVIIGHGLNLDHSTALLGAALYLLNFGVTNLNLVGLVDSAEGCFLLIAAWAMLRNRWFLLPACGVAGALAKETFAPLSAVFVAGWWMAEAKHRGLRFSGLAWIAGLAVASAGTVTIAMSAVAGGLVWPWEFAAYMQGGGSFSSSLLRCVTDHTFWFVFAWLLPLGLLRAPRFPRPWLWATMAAFCLALLMGAYDDARGNTSRALFNVAGPLLSLSAAVFLGNPRDTA